ncbi:MAG: hypothetical protein KGY54_01555 [Oleiphilaceae bacterium]|nr:hypothetical protein [Oleiphilaceae bacterium]
MRSSVTVKLHIGDAIPRASEKSTGEILALWQQISRSFHQRPFTAPRDTNGKPGPYLLTLDASSLVKTLEAAKTRSKTFNAHRQAYVEDPSVKIEGELEVRVESEDHEPGELEAYHVASVFIQQLAIAANLIIPGSFHLLGTRFMGEGAHRYEAQAFDSVIFYGARKAVKSAEWPRLQPLPLETVWAWLDSCEVSHKSTAIKDINKVLFTLLKIAEQRHEYSARTVLMVVYQLELLLNCREPGPLKRSRNRTRLILGEIPEAADCFNELFEVRDSLFLASQPVHRPTLICHTTAREIQAQSGQHNRAVESGTAMVLALLQDLIEHNARNYHFIENFSYR